MTNNEKINNILKIAKEERPVNWRYGQAVFNFALDVFPQEVNQIRASPSDCFHRDDKVILFIDNLKSILKTNDIK